MVVKIAIPGFHLFGMKGNVLYNSILVIFSKSIGTSSCIASIYMIPVNPSVVFTFSALHAILILSIVIVVKLIKVSLFSKYILIG